MRLDGFAEAEVDGALLRVESPGLSVWITYSRSGEGGNFAWFDWDDGCVIVKNPDLEVRMKMCSIARSFGAEVFGDDGERYVHGEPVPDDQPENVPTGGTKPWWKRVIGG